MDAAVLFYNAGRLNGRRDRLSLETQVPGSFEPGTRKTARAVYPLVTLRPRACSTSQRTNGAEASPNQAKVLGCVGITVCRVAALVIAESAAVQLCGESVAGRPQRSFPPVTPAIASEGDTP